MRLLLTPLAALLFTACPALEIDNDGDGYAIGEDCNDQDENIHPGVAEVCNRRDDDCNGLTDDLDGNPTFYLDQDGDGYGLDTISMIACDALPGYVDVGGDCHDSNASVYPGAVEACDGADNDCNGVVDDGPGALTWYGDSDGDGVGDDSAAVQACAQPDGHAAVGGDCDDSEPAVYPGNTEVCDGLDNDCNGVVDEGFDGGSTWYLDTDGDGFGADASAVVGCEAPADHVGAGGDCDDGAAEVYPGAEERCDEIDNDCDGDVDGGAVDAVTWYADVDEDLYGDLANSVDSCDALEGHVTESTDCDDTNDEVNPSASEVCDGVDTDCDGSLGSDEIDGDGDGEPSCAGDCDDSDPNVNSSTVWHADNDFDGFGSSTDFVASCVAIGGYVQDDQDCDDGDGAVHPGAPEICNGVDDDCNGTRDDGFSLTSAWPDRDADGFGDDSEPSIEVCAAPVGYATSPGDCDDGAASVSPGEPEDCADGLDNNCDGPADCDDLDDCEAVDEVCWECGDGVVDPNEGCDVAEPWCDSTCEITPACDFPQAEHPNYTTPDRDVALCGNNYDDTNITTACGVGWSVCSLSVWNARYPRGVYPNGSKASWGAEQSDRCGAPIWEAQRPTGAATWDVACGNPYNPWNSGKYLLDDVGSTVLKSDGNCCSWDSNFAPGGPVTGYAVYCCRD